MSRKIGNEDLRDRFISRVVSGKTFADVGGLWNTIGEKVSVAAAAGAKKLTMIDVLPEDNEWWDKFKDRIISFNITDCECISGDINSVSVGTFDVVHSSGILYHLPNPISYIEKLCQITNEYLVLTTAIIPGLIINRHGILITKPGRSLYVPSLSQREKKIYARFYTGGNKEMLLGGINHEAVFTLQNYSPWWWLMTVETIKSICNIAGFDILENGSNFSRGNHSFLLRRRS